MRVVVTRPKEDAARWVKAFAQQGIDAISLPLIEIRAADDTNAVLSAWRALDRFVAVMFVSAAAVEHFFAGYPGAAHCWPSGLATRTWAPGPGTAAALMRHGVPAQQIDAPAPDSGQFDSEALWRRIGPTVGSGQGVLIVRGSDRDPGQPSDGSDRGQGRDWLAQRLTDAGARVEFVVAYRRAAPAEPQLRQAIAELDSSCAWMWLFTSSQAIENLTQAVPLHDWSASRALVTHPRIGVAARAAGFGVVQESRPALEDVVSSIKSVP
jgi:uroporphyrinogen-III synthase